MVDEVGFRTDSGKYNAGTKMAQLPHEALSAVENYAILNEALLSGRARDVSDEPKVDKTPCIILGSGGSLDLALPLLHEWKGGIICTTSHALSLMRFGVEPTHIVALDPFCAWDEIDGVEWRGTRTKLVTVPTVWPTLIERWPGELLLYRQNMGQPESYYQTTLNYQYSRRDGARGRPLYPRIKTEVTLFACSPPLQLFIAQVLGYGDIFLVGCDFAYTYGKDRFTNWTVKESVKRIALPGNAPPVETPTVWEPHPHMVEDLAPEQTASMITTMAGIPADPVHTYYKKNMISAWRLSGQDVWTTDKGAVTEMPYIDLERAIRRQGRITFGRLSKEEKAKRAEEYLAMVGAFVLEFEKGLSFIEATDPAVDLLTFMRKANRYYTCRACNVEVTANDELDHDNMDCPACKAPKSLLHKNRADVDANMERIHRLLRAAKKKKEEWERRKHDER